MVGCVHDIGADGVSHRTSTHYLGSGEQASHHFPPWPSSSSSPSVQQFQGEDWPC